jgi:hypothetical protein
MASIYGTAKAREKPRIRATMILALCQEQIFLAWRG